MADFAKNVANREDQIEIKQMVQDLFDAGGAIVDDGVKYKEVVRPCFNLSLIHTGSVNINTTANLTDRYQISYAVHSSVFYVTDIVTGVRVRYASPTSILKPIRQMDESNKTIVLHNDVLYLLTYSNINAISIQPYDFNLIKADLLNSDNHNKQISIPTAGRVIIPITGSITTQATGTLCICNGELYASLNHGSALVDFFRIPIAEDGSISTYVDLGVRLKSTLVNAGIPSGYLDNIPDIREVYPTSNPGVGVLYIHFVLSTNQYAYLVKINLTTGAAASSVAVSNTYKSVIDLGEYLIMHTMTSINSVIAYDKDTLTLKSITPPVTSSAYSTIIPYKGGFYLWRPRANTATFNATTSTATATNIPSFIFTGVATYFDKDLNLISTDTMTLDMTEVIVASNGNTTFNNVVLLEQSRLNPTVVVSNTGGIVDSSSAAYFVKIGAKSVGFKEVVE